MTIVITNATEDMVKRSFNKLLLHSLRLDSAATFQTKEGENLRISWEEVKTLKHPKMLWMISFFFKVEVF